VVNKTENRTWESFKKDAENWRFKSKLFAKILKEQIGTEDKYKYDCYFRKIEDLIECDEAD